MDIATWLREIGLEGYEQAFRERGIDAERLAQLTADDLSALGVASVPHRQKLLAGFAARLGGPGTADLTSDTPAEPLAATPRLLSCGAGHRQLTVMLCGLVGSTQLSEQRDPEHLHEVIRAFHACVAAAVERFEGHVAKVTGDAVLAYFGYPKAHEDDAERAVRAGLAVTEAVQRPRPGHELPCMCGWGSPRAW